MTIETKYSYGDKIWLMRNNLALEVKITQVGVDPFSNNVNYPTADNIFYYVSNSLDADWKVYQHGVFETKESLLQSL